MPRDHRGWRVAPAPDGRGSPDPSKSPAPHRSRGFVWFVLALLAINLASVFLLSPGGQQRVKVPFSPYFLSELQSGQVVSIAAKGDTIQGTFKSLVHYPASDTKAAPTSLFATQVPSFWNNDELTAMLRAEKVQVNAQSTTQSTTLIVSVLLGFGPTLLIVGLFVLFARRAAKSGGMGALGNFGRSKARRIDPATIRVTFADVAGIDEAKAELTEIVDFLRNPQRYGRLGGRMPHGVLLSGAPGTGKTLLARAVAGEAHAAFFSMAASEFIEARLVLDLPELEHHCALVLLDDIDSDHVDSAFSPGPPARRFLVPGETCLRGRSRPSRAHACWAPQVNPSARYSRR